MREPTSFKKLSKFIVLACLICMPCAASEFEMADRVVIKKADRKLFLMKNGSVLRSMDVALGLLPKGDKKEEGDFHTPEGSYNLIKRNPDSRFFLSIQISYPNDADIREARALGVDPGGQIMIHGQPNRPKHSVAYYQQTDWTDGCIAVSNADMVDIWLMTSADTSVLITP
ncbi:MAG TPA: L,D-transpeptidase family protein [Gammaproteobacteria bacterium]|jgi:murein L,D-transpeptidase YafK|nr:L,D-transpeptidase family protein [Gammaproteobacteria bacterium]HJP37501.1 L,D-transpeptidase family protein [Gammaproteobacteria bacterium]